MQKGKGGAQVAQSGRKLCTYLLTARMLQNRIFVAPDFTTQSQYTQDCALLEDAGLFLLLVVP